jgi:hypothetical protein
MTDTSSFFTTHQSRDVPRNQWGQYLLPDPVSGEQEGWVRATTMAATMAEQYGLSIWKQRQVVWGLSRRPDLLTLASTITGPEDKKALGEIVKEAHVAAGTDAKANRGTAIHKAIQASENGAHHLVPEELRPHVTKYFEAMKRERLRVIPEYVERTVIVRQYHVAGTFDNLILCPDGRIRVGDKKTGRMDYSDVEFAVQMSLYANADAMFNYDTGRYEPMPEIAKDYAILMHIDPETGHTEIQRVNIAWGWVFARTAAEVMDIRKVKNIITPYVADEVFPENREAFGWSTADIPKPTDIPVVVSSAVPDGSFAVVPAWPNGVPLDANHHGGTVPGGIVNTISPVPAEFQAFWSDDRHDTDPEPAESVNGVPLEQYGKPSRWGCARGESCEMTGTDGLHSDGTVCLYGNARPGPVPEQTHADLTAAAIEAQKPSATPQSVMAAAGAPMGIDDAAVASTSGSNVDDLMHRLTKLKNKAAVQSVARELMTLVGAPDAIKLNQYQHKIASAIITLAWKSGVDIPGVDKDGKPFGRPTHEGPDPDAWKNGAAHTPKPGTTATEPEQPVTDFEAQERSAVESIRRAETLAHLKIMHDHFTENTRIGWTDTMQSAARTRAAELDGASELTPLEMIQGATSKETLAKAWSKATDDGRNKPGWTPEMEAAALAKQAQLTGVATSGNQ